MKQTLWQSLALAGLMTLGGATLAASDTPAPGQPSGNMPPPAATQEKMTTGSPPDIVKPVVPGRAEKADSAFKKLDPTGKGYVVKEDTKDLAGFDQAFDKADPKHTGKLNYSQFKKAWKSYASEQTPNAGKAAW